MTIGSKIKPGPVMRAYAVAHPSGVETELGTVETGHVEHKTWNGADSPPAKRAYTIRVDTLPGFYKKVHRLSRTGRAYIAKVWVPPRHFRTRVYEDRKRRKHREEHEYSMTAKATYSSPFVNRQYSIDAFAGPPLYIPLCTQTPTQTVYRDSLGTFGDGFVITHQWDTNADIALLGKLREKVAGTEFNMGVFLGEGRESLNMIANTATSLAKAFKRVKKGDLPGAARALGAKFDQSKHRPSRGDSYDVASQRWLELQYGWIPLVSDCHDAAGMLATRLNAPFVQTYRARLKRPSITAKTQAWLQCDAEAYTSASMIARLSEVSEVQLVGLVDPLSVAWELLPWSFVFDWFIPIGNYLSARSLSSALTGTYITTKVVRSKTSFSGLAVGKSGSPCFGVVNEYEGLTANTSRTTMTRSVSTSLSVPLPSFKKLSDVYSWKRAANAVSLVIQSAIR